VDMLLRVAVLTGDQQYSRLATPILRSMREFMTGVPMGCAHWLSVLDFYLSTAKEVAIVGPRDDEATEALLAVVQGRYMSNRVLLGTILINLPSRASLSSKGKAYSAVSALPTSASSTPASSRLPRPRRWQSS
jgi:uncharacterized protein YyaL (SSP411 family)